MVGLRSFTASSMLAAGVAPAPAPATRAAVATAEDYALTKCA